MIHGTSDAVQVQKVVDRPEPEKPESYEPDKPCIPLAQITAMKPRQPYQAERPPEICCALTFHWTLYVSSGTAIVKVYQKIERDRILRDPVIF